MSLKIIRSEMYTKQDHVRDQPWMDNAMAVIEASRKERLIFRKQLLRKEKRWLEYEKKIRSHEKNV